MSIDQAEEAVVPQLTQSSDIESQEHIRAFVTRFLQSNGATVHAIGKGSVSAQLPTSLAGILGVEPNLKLCFRPDEISSDTEFLTFGNPLLDQMLKMAGTRGLVTSLLFTSSLDSDFIHLAITEDFTTKATTTSPRSYRRLNAILERLQFKNARCRILQRRILHQLQVLFYFRISFISDEKREQIVPVLIDPVTETINSLVDVDEAVSFRLPVYQTGTKQRKPSKPAQVIAPEPISIEQIVGTGQSQLPGEPYTILRLYRKASEHLETKVAAELASFEAEARGHLERDVARIEEYYAGLARETLDPLRKVFRRMASLSVRTQLARSYEAQNRFAEQLSEMKQEASTLESRYEEELTQLSIEKERRISELSAKYQAKAELHLTNVAALRVPRIEYTCRLQGPARREITFLYDCLRERLVDLQCEACAKPMHNVILCACGDILCDDCGTTCACGKPVCVNCAQTHCHVCGGLICTTCQPTCPLGLATSTEMAVCEDCRQEVCPQCVRLSGMAATSGW